jgi:hypothetical protein
MKIKEKILEYRTASTIFYLKWMIPIYIIDFYTTIYNLLKFQEATERIHLHSFFHNQFGVVKGEVLLIPIILFMIIFIGLAFGVVIKKEEENKTYKRTSISLAIIYFLIISPNIINILLS